MTPSTDTPPHPSAPASLRPVPSPPDVGQGIDYERFLDCVHCGLCTAACPTYLETGNENDSPRGRIYLMRAVVDGKLALTPTVERHLELCLDCRSCESACPSGVQYGRLIEPFRIDMQKAQKARTGSSGSWFERQILHRLFPHAGRLRWALLPARIMQKTRLDRLAEKLGLLKLFPEPIRRMYRLLPRLRPGSPRMPAVLPAQGKRRARVGLFTGCVAEAMFGETGWATARVLQANGCEVVIPPTQACCGAIHYHSGNGTPALDFARRNAEAFAASDLDAIIINVAGCGAMLKDYGHIGEELHAPDELRSQLASMATRVRDVSEFLVALGPVKPTAAVRLRATYHDACHLCHAQKIREQPRQLLSLIPGLELIPLPETEVCCGAAGSYNLTEPEMADRLGERKLRNILSTGAQAVITGNAGCSLQIQAMLRQAGKNIPVYHPVDLLDMSYRG